MNKRLTKWDQRWRYNTTANRPSRDELGGMSPSEFKTLLKQRGFKVSRNFFDRESVAQCRNRLYRFRWWGDTYNKLDAFFVDISCPIRDFDRWANSTDNTMYFTEWLKGSKL